MSDTHVVGGVGDGLCSELDSPLKSKREK